MAGGGVRALARVLTDFIETRATWRRLGRAMLQPRLRLIRPPESATARWRDIYGDFANRANIDRTLADTWLVASSRRAYGGLILSTIPRGLMLHTMRVPRPYRGLGVAGVLLSAVLDELESEAPLIWLQVLPDNRPAVRLYRRFGFLEQEPLADLRREGHLLMRLDWAEYALTEHRRK